MNTTDIDNAARPPLRTREAARRLGCCAHTLRHMHEDGRLPAYRLHPRGPLLWRSEDVEAYVERQIQGARLEAS